MGVLSNLRGSRTATAGEGLPLSNGLSFPASSSSSVFVPKKKWSNFLPVFVVLVVIAEIAFLGRFDMSKNAALVDWADRLFFKSSSLGDSGFHSEGIEQELGGLQKNEGYLDSNSCEEWLEKEDAVVYKRDFNKDPISVISDQKESKTCSVGCQFGLDSNRAPDAIFGSTGHGETPCVHRSMESAQNYEENNIAVARRIGFNIVMTTSLSSDVPVGYFSWTEYDIMAPMQPKTEKALAAAFISNCRAHNFRLEALKELEKAKIGIDSYGDCHQNRDGNVDKVETLKHYKFSFAFENSNEEDYVTEKFFQSLVAGTIPVVVGAPNIQDFAPAPGSVLLIKELEDVESIAKTMKYLAENPDAYNHSLRWKYEGPSDSFKALVDMAAVHSSCRLCIHLATMIRQKEERSPGFKKRPCRCTRGSETLYHLYVRERGRFEMVSIFLR